MAPETQKSKWTFFSNHGHVYFLLATHNNIVLRDVSRMVGITERTVQGIVQDLEDAGYIKKVKQGRNNVYKILSNKTLRHPLEENVLLSDLTRLIIDRNSKDKKPGDT